VWDKPSCIIAISLNIAGASCSFIVFGSDVGRKTQSPSVVGGTAPSIFFLYKEGLSGGQSTAVVLTAIFLDELFFIFSVPIVYLFYGNNIQNL
jgi:hypothetical protein